MTENNLNCKGLDSDNLALSLSMDYKNFDTDTYDNDKNFYKDYDFYKNQL